MGSINGTAARQLIYEEKEEISTILEIRDLSFAYPGGEKRALNHISLSVEEGEFLVLCGKSGCGKSTLLSHLKSPLMPHGKRKGTIYMEGMPLLQMSNREQTEKIGFVLQNPDNQIVTDKVWHELAFGLESLGYATEEIRIRVAEMASYFGIQDWFYKNVTELSGGQKQLLNLASIMALHPDLLILDEPTSQLDPIAASDFLETVKKINRDLGTTVILTEHRLEEVFPVADRVVVMEEGEILAEGSPTYIGKVLKESNHEMFLAMPVPMQIYAKVPSEKKCPVTVRDGRKWLEAECREREILPFDNQKSEIHGGFLSDRSSGKRVFGERKERRREDVKAFKQNPVLSCSDIWFRYEKDLPDVVKGLNLKIYEGEFYCLLGGNGTGKTTTLSLISRLRKPYRGKILLNGKDIRKYSDKELFRGFLGVLPQNPQSLFVKKTVELELFEMIGGEKEKKDEEYHLDMEKRKVVDGIIKVTHLENLLTRHPYDLSGGEQQRLALAKILLLRPKLLLMDEPTKGLDSYFKEEFASILNLLKEQGVTIFMISHDIEFCARYGDRCGLFFDGSIASSGKPQEFFSGNNFYTTAANRMARKYFPKAVTGKDVIECLMNS
ncbi:MAG: energy-coupling factor transporter ATPase [Lachnospiraceae bacterium]|nr:energy-coupling factor transporter ATPase [Lachnospiraceae bacterium]